MDFNLNKKITLNDIKNKLLNDEKVENFIVDFLFLSKKNNWKYLNQNYSKELLYQILIEILLYLIQKNKNVNDKNFIHSVRNGHILIECYEEENLNNKYLCFSFNISY